MPYNDHDRRSSRNGDRHSARRHKHRFHSSLKLLGREVQVCEGGTGLYALARLTVNS